MPRAYLTAGAVLPASVQRELKLDDATSSSVQSLQTGGERHD
jgi:hypothetical protein